MRITRDDEGMRFVAECDNRSGFIPQDIECVKCGRRIDPIPQGTDIGLECRACCTRIKTFWSEAEMRVYLAENWNLLRQACTHPSVSMVQDCE